MERATESHIRKEAQEIIEASLDLVERMLRILDRLDPDPDLEDTGDDEPDNDGEPSLGGPGQYLNGQLEYDLEMDRCDDEPDSDAEPEDGV